MENKALIFLFLFLLLIPTSIAHLPSGEHILIYEVSPFSYSGSRVDYVCLYNPTDDRVNLSGYILTDFEGNIYLTGEILPYSKIYIAANESSFFRFFGFYPNFTFSSLPHTGRFSLANHGDEVVLIHGKIVDMVVYGNSNYSGDGWYGPAVPIAQGHVLRRTGLEDTDSSKDWSNYHRIGQSDFQPSEYSAKVEILTLPDDLSEIYRAIKTAKSSIYVEMYTISSMQIADVLVHKEKNGVNVRILVEGMPVGGMSNSEKYTLNFLIKHNVSVKIMANNLGAHNRYAYVHSKFLVIDRSVSIILTENFDSLSILPAGNRGFGTIVYSKELSKQLISIFDEDAKNVQDIRNFSNFAYSSYYSEPAEARSPEFRPLNITSELSLIIAPDYAQGSLKKFIDSQKWLDIEAMYIREAPLAWAYPKARRILTWEPASGYDMKKFDSDKINLRMLHGKMMIGDHAVWLGSLNFGNFSMRENREVSVILHSSEAVNYYERVFNHDWLALSKPVAVMHIMKNGNKITVDMTASQGKITEYIVYLDGREIYHGKSERTSFSVSPGSHTITGMVLAENGSSKISQRIEIEGATPDSRIFATLLIFALFLYKLWKRHG